MQHCHLAARLFRIVCLMRPCINSWCFRMTYKLEHLNDSFPHGFSLKGFFDWHALDVLRLNAMQMTNYVFQFFDISNWHGGLQIPKGL